MFRKFILATAAVAALGSAALVSTSTPADAMRAGIHRGGGGHHVGRMHMGGGRIHHGPRMGVRHVHVRHVHVRPHWRGHGCWRHPHACRPGHVRYYRPYVYAAPVVAAAYAAAPVTNRCTCLTKDYLPNGTVLFKDLCTKEEALGPQPMQSGEVQQYQPGMQTSQGPYTQQPTQAQ